MRHPIFRLYAAKPLQALARNAANRRSALPDQERADAAKLRSALVDVPVEPVGSWKEALTAAAQELDRISCVQNVTETKDTYEQFQLAKSFADRGAAAAWRALRCPPHREGEDSAELDRKFKLGDRVTKTKDSSWNGRIVGFYSTAMTPVGYAVESEREPGSVQIYPESALAATRSGSATTSSGGDHDR